MRAAHTRFSSQENESILPVSNRKMSMAENMRANHIALNADNECILQAFFREKDPEVQVFPETGDNDWQEESSNLLSQTYPPNSAMCQQELLINTRQHALLNVKCFFLRKMSLRDCNQNARSSYNVCSETNTHLS